MKLVLNPRENFDAARFGYACMRQMVGQARISRIVGSTAFLLNVAFFVFGAGLLPAGAGWFVIGVVVWSLLAALGLGLGTRWGAVIALIFCVLFVALEIVPLIIILGLPSEKLPLLTKAMVTTIQVLGIGYWIVTGWLAGRVFSTASVTR